MPRPIVARSRQQCRPQRKELNQAGYPAPLLAWQPQLRFVAEQAARRAASTPAGSLTSLGYHLRMVADFAGAGASYERALAIFEKQLGPEHPNVALLVNNLGSVLKTLGDLAGARAAFERALRIDEASFGQGHPSVARDVNNLGSVLRDLGDLAGARAAYERALRIDEASFGPDHPNVAIRVNNLGNVLQDLGDLAGAGAAFERALRIDEASFGPDHPKVAIRRQQPGLCAAGPGRSGGRQGGLRAGVFDLRALPRAGSSEHAHRARPPGEPRRRLKLSGVRRPGARMRQNVAHVTHGGAPPSAPAALSRILLIGPPGDPGHLD